MLHLYWSDALLLQYFRGDFHGRDLIRGTESADWKGKREKDQPVDVYSGSIICTEIYILVIQFKKKEEELHAGFPVCSFLFAL